MKKHPTNRAERRYHRERVIKSRRYVFLHIWNRNNDYQFMKDVSNPLIDISYVIEKWKNSEFPYKRL